MNIPATPTPIPLDNLPDTFKQNVFNMFRHIINGFRGAQIPFTHVTIWDYIVWVAIAAAVIKAWKLMYGKGDASKHE